MPESAASYPGSGEFAVSLIGETACWLPTGCEETLWQLLVLTRQALVLAVTPPPDTSRLQLLRRPQLKLFHH